MDAKESRKALAKALSAHDMDAAKLFLHPSFVVRGTDGLTLMNRTGLLARLPVFFRSHPEYKQSVRIENSIVSGNSATLTTRRSEILHVLWWPHTVTSYWTEKWKKVKGRWVLAGETPKPA